MAYIRRYSTTRKRNGKQVKHLRRGVPRTSNGRKRFTHTRMAQSAGELSHPRAGPGTLRRPEQREAQHRWAEPR